MSACMRSLYSSDQWAPGFWLALLCGWGGGGVLASFEDFRAPTFSLSVTRDDVGLEDEFELFMQLLGTYFNLFTLLVLACDAGSHEYEHRQCRLYRDAKTRQLPRSVLYSMLCNEYRMMGGLIQSIVETAIGVSLPVPRDRLLWDNSTPHAGSRAPVLWPTHA